MSNSVQQRLTGKSLDERWHALSFDLRLSSRYHAERRRFFERSHAGVCALTLMLGLATLAALLMDIENGRQIAIITLLLMAVGAAVDSLLGFVRRAGECARLARRFIELECKFLGAMPTEAAYVEMFVARRKLEAEEPPALPYLVQRCHREIALHDGYEDGEDGVPKPLGFFGRVFAHVLPFSPRA